MRLLNTQDFTLRERKEGDHYCTLSHAWTDGLDHEIQHDNLSVAETNADGIGSQQLAGACKIARGLGFAWLWADSCCIDRSDDHEVDDAINTMFKWHFEADLCLVCLHDVDMNGDIEMSVECREQFRRSTWHTKSWTLQALLASKSIRFYDKTYQLLGTKDNLIDELVSITGIAPLYLCNLSKITSASIATRMSWAAKRSADRKEDEAYSLLGLFDMNMPTRYGEQEQAFFRLQLQLLSLQDESLFAWLPHDCSSNDETYGMFARSPRDFARSGGTVTIDMPRKRHCEWRDGKFWFPRLQLHPVSTSQRFLTKIALACKHESTDQIIGIHLVWVNDSWYRYRAKDFAYVPLINKSPDIEAEHDRASAFPMTETLRIAQPDPEHNQNEQLASQIVKSATDRHCIGILAYSIILIIVLHIFAALAPSTAASLLGGMIGVYGFPKLRQYARSRLKYNGESDYDLKQAI